MAATLLKTHHVDDCDLSLLSEDERSALLNGKFILRAGNNDEGASEIEAVFDWIKENVKNFYHVRGPEHDQDSIKYYIYFVDKDEAVQFKLTFPTK